jgi:2-methylcitrate dehydratase PrpD
MDLPAAGSELSRADNGREPAKERLHLRDGRVLSAFVQHAKGVLENSLSEAELWSKFDDCVDGAMPPERAAAIRARLERFEDLPRVAELMTDLRGLPVVA